VTDHGLSGRVVLVTGASGGIGAAISRVLAEAGATIALGYGRLALAVLTNGFITSKVFPIDGGMYPR
jgi:NAD(P)-dependent dehydrogenase (short-subunit alcohol dehydrogenase family)